MKLAVVVALFLWFPAVAKEPVRTVIYGRAYGPESLPLFDKGYLLFVNRPSGVEVWGPDGRLVFSTELTNPPGAHVMSVAIDSDGTVAASVAYQRPSQGSGGGIAFLDRSGKQIRFTETERYMPAHVCFDANHNLWTFGWQREAVRNESEDSEDYLLFRKYSNEGKQLGAYAQRSLFPIRGLSPGGASGGMMRVRASNDRVGAWAYSGQTSGTPEWIEVGLDGPMIGQWKLGSDPHGGTAFVSSIGLCRQDPNRGNPRIDCFDRKSQEWKALSNVSVTDENDRTLGILLGADGDYLVFGKSEGTIRLSWVRANVP